MEDERVELEADIEKLQHTLQEDKSQWQYDYIVDSDEDESEDDDDVLFIDLDKQGSAAASVASASARSAGGRTTPSAHSGVSQPTTTETQSVGTEDDGEMFKEVGVVLETLDSTANLPATLESCLVLNHTYQDIISHLITKIDLELAENKEAQRSIEEETKESNLQQMTKKRFPYCATLPYFKLKFGSTPAHNEDTRLKRLTDEPDLDRRPDPPWFMRHKRVLTDAVVEDSLKKLLQPMLRRRELEEEKLTEVGEGTPQWHEIRDRITHLDIEIEDKQKTPRNVLLQDVDPEKVDWMKISNMNFEGKRHWAACRRAWEHSVDPRLNQEPMKPDEERKLSFLIRETNATNWVYIAQQLGTGRTPFQCLQYYQQNLNPQMLSREWSIEEDEQLIQVVEKCQQYHFNWRKVSQYMEGRSGLQCYKRYSKLDPNINKGFWTEVEDAQLMTAVHLLGTHNWGRVTELVPGRTREQCRERYVNSLDPNISGQPWTYEEDKTLLEQVAIHGKGNWVKCLKALPGRTDNQILQRYRRLEDWKKKSDWFKKQSTKDRDLLQGNNLPLEEKRLAQEKNWEQFKTRLGVFPDDYLKQQRDRDNGEMCVPRPPFMIGLAVKSGAKVWERRIQLHKLIENHIDKLKEKYNFMEPSVPGVFQLQDAISQLSQDCVSQREELMTKRTNNMGQLLHNLPSAINVKDLLTVSRGGKVHEKKVRGPVPRKKKKDIAPRLHEAMKVDSQLRKIVRSNFKDRSMKKGRPRRFFWDTNGEQVLSDEDMAELKATTLGLYLKSLGIDYIPLLQQGRRTYPQLFHRLQQEHLAAMCEDTKPENLGSKKEKQALRRSYRKQRQRDGDPDDTDPFSLSPGQANSMRFSDWQKQRDYELLEWLARMEDVPMDSQLSEGTAAPEDIPAAASVEVGDNVPANSACEGGAKPVIGHGMSLVHASIQQAMEEQEERRRQELQASVVTVVQAGGGSEPVKGGMVDSTESGGVNVVAPLSHASTSAGSTSTHLPPPPSRHPSCTCPASTSEGERGDHSQSLTTPPPRQFPNLPPTFSSIQSFKNLLVKRLGLIKKAGSYHNLHHYLSKRDEQMARLIHAGNNVKELNRGTIDLSRMMNRFSQETNYIQRARRGSKKKGDKSHPPLTLTDTKDFDFKVLEAARKTNEYKLLQSRFQAVFAWPALLSTIYPPFQRREYSNKAGGQSFGSKDKVTKFETLRKRMPMLKSKGFYKFANKSLEEKEEILKKKHEQRILKQVQALMADENDPNPYVTMDPDSDDDTGNDRSSAPASLSQSRPEAQSHPNKSDSSADSAGEEDLAPPPKKKRKTYRKRDPNSKSTRKSSRACERKTYVDSINRRRLIGPRKPKGLGVVEPVEPPAERVRPARLAPAIRRAFINAIAEHRNKDIKKYAIRIGQWNPGGYVSDDDDDNMAEEMQEEYSWVADLTPEQQNSMALLERDSIVEKEGGASTLVQSLAGDNPVTDQSGHGTLPESKAVGDTDSITIESVPLHRTSVAYLPVGSQGASRCQSQQTTASQLSYMPSSVTGEVKVSVLPSFNSAEKLGVPSAVSEVSEALSVNGAVKVAEPSSVSSAVNVSGAVQVGEVSHSESRVSSLQFRRMTKEVVVLDDDDDDDEPSVASLLAAKRAQH